MSEQTPDQEPERPRLPTPWIVWALVAAIAVSYAIFMFLPIEVQEELDVTYGLMPARYDASNPIHFRSLGAMIAPLFTNAFLHVAWWHAGTNAFFLFVLGRWPALRMGWWRFLVLFFVSTVGGALAYLLINPGSEEVAVGASGAVCGVFMAYFLSVRPRWQDALREPFIRNQLGMIMLLNVVVMGVVSELGWFPIAWEAHLGGFIGGAIAYIALEQPMPRLHFA